MISSFDKVAKLYDTSIPSMSFEFLELIQSRFQLNTDDKVIDLGCGTGVLALQLSNYSSCVEGLDASEEMIRLANARDKRNLVTWIYSPVESFILELNRYKLIISLESFHLFPDNLKIFTKCVSSLAPSGYLCIGWIRFHWEPLFIKIIRDVLESHGVVWGGKDNPAEVNLYSIIQESNIYPIISQVHIESIAIKESSHVSQIANYLISIDKTAKLENRVRNSIRRELEFEFSKLIKSKWLTGKSIYTISWIRRNY